MEYIALGKTNLLVSRTAFGAESFDCAEIEAFKEEADEVVCAIVHNAYAGGINFFDTSHSKPVCEKRLGLALHGIRQNVFLATKSSGQSVRELRDDLNRSLEALETDYIDLFQLENPLIVPQKNSPDGLYNELVNLKARGTIKHFGIATQDIELAEEAVKSGLYEVVQFPFSMISPEQTEELVDLCAKTETGCIAMQPLNGGIISDVSLAFAYLNSKENVVPVWGIHKQEELDQILYFNNRPPIMDEQSSAEIQKAKDFFN